MKPDDATKKKIYRIRIILIAELFGVSFCLGSLFSQGGAWPAILAGVCAWGCISSIQTLGKLGRVVQYQAILQDQTMCSTKALAQGMQKPLLFVQNDITAILQKGLWDNVVLDQTKEHLFTGAATYHNWLQQHARTEKPTVFMQCQTFLKDLETQKTYLLVPQVRQQLDLLEQHTRQLMRWLEKQNDETHTIRRFAEYYLPTTINLLETYHSLETQNNTTANEIQTSICNSLETINSAFEQLLAGQLQEVSRSVNAEISAMETMLSQEGLARPDFIIDDIGGDTIGTTKS